MWIVTSLSEYDANKVWFGWFIGYFTSHSMIFPLYNVTAHGCAGGLNKNFDLRYRRSEEEF